MRTTRFLQSLKSRFAKRTDLADEVDQEPVTMESLSEASDPDDLQVSTNVISLANAPAPDRGASHLDRAQERKELAEAAASLDTSDELSTLMAVAAKVEETQKDMAQAKAQDAAQLDLLDAIEAADAERLSALLPEIGVNTRLGPHGVTPLTHALTSPPVDINIVIMLLDEGADAQLPTPLGGDALTAMVLGTFDNWSATEIHEVCKALVALGANLDNADADGLAPLQRAILRKNAPVLEALARLGADVNRPFAQDAKPDFLSGFSPLHAAVMDPELIDLLLNYGADPTEVNGKGQTPARYAAQILEEGVDKDEAAALARSLELLDLSRAA